MVAARTDVQPTAKDAVLLKGLDLNLLLALDVLLQEKSVTRASDRLFRSQPTMSGILARLREYFGDELLVRVGRGIELTPFAEGLIEPLKTFLAAANAVAGARPEQPLETLEQVFTLILSDYAAEVLLPPLLDRVDAVAPLVRIRLKNVIDDVQHALDSGSADFLLYPKGLIATSGGSPYRGEKVLEDEWVCIGDATRYAGIDALDMQSYSTLPLVTVRYDNGDLLMVCERPFEEQGIRRNIRAFVPYFSLLPRAVEGSRRIAVMHRRGAAAAAQRYGIKMLATPLVIPRLELELCWHVRHDTSRPHMWLRSLIHEVCASIESGQEES